MNQREQQKIETKKRIYKCAFQLFSEKSYDKVKISDIAKKAGVSTGTIYFHYTSKGDIIDEGYHYFDMELENDYNNDKPRKGKEAVYYLIRYQIKDIVQMGYQIATISFKNQLDNENEYLLSRERFLYRKLIENAGLIIKSKKEVVEFVDMILRTSRGGIYDWCLRKGSYDLQDAVMKEIKIITAYYTKINK